MCHYNKISQLLFGNHVGGKWTSSAVGQQLNLYYYLLSVHIRCYRGTMIQKTIGPQLRFWVWAFKLPAALQTMRRMSQRYEGQTKNNIEKIFSHSQQDWVMTSDADQSVVMSSEAVYSAAAADGSARQPFFSLFSPLLLTLSLLRTFRQPMV